MHITKENLIATRYIDIEQTMIDIIIKDNKGNQQSIAVSADPNNETFQSLLQVKTLAQLQESHDNFVDSNVVRNRKMDAWYNVYNFTSEQLDFIANADETTLANFNRYANDNNLSWDNILKNNVEESEVFKLKLIMFEDPDIERSKKPAQKTKLRKATNVIEAFYYYGLIKGVGKK